MKAQQRKAISAAIVAAACILAAVFYVVRWTPRSMPNIAIESSERCDNSAPQTQHANTNPNQMLFIGCGGFMN